MNISLTNWKVVQQAREQSVCVCGEWGKLQRLVGRCDDPSVAQGDPGEWSS